MGEAIRVLIAEDKPADAELILRELRRSGFEPDWRRVDTEADYLQALAPDFDIVLCDYEMQGFDAPRALRLLQERGFAIPFIIVSGTIGEETAVAAMKQGATDYLLKDRLTRLGEAVRHALDEERQRAARKRAEEALRQSEERLRLAIDAAGVGSWEVDLATGEAIWSANIFAMFGLHPDETRPSLEMWRTLVHPDDLEGMVQAIEAGRRDRSLAATEYRIRRADDGRVAWLSVAGRFVYDDRGDAVRFLGIVFDITARREAERRQAMQHAVTRVLAESISLSAAAPGVIEAVSEALGAEFGVLWEIDRQANLLRCADVWHGQGLAADELETETRRLTFAPGVGLPGRVWASGTPLALSDVSLDGNFARALSATNVGLRRAFAFPILYRGEVTGVFDFLGPEMQEPDRELLDTLGAIGSQMSQFIDHRRAEQHLAQAQKMEAVGQLAGGIAHDFNNLLGVILGYAQLASKELGPDHQTQRRIAAVCKAAERAAALTRQILTFSRQHPAETRVCDVNRIVEEMEKMLRRLIGEDVQLVVALGEDLGRVRADPGQLEQVIMNLAVNARDAMPSGGRLTIETSNIDLDEAYGQSHPEVRPGPHVMVAVGDSGEGMAPGTLARIFEPFFTTKEPGKGTGLGLAVVFGIVSQSGGSISVYSEAGHGSTFKVYLPRVDRTEEAEAIAPLVAGARGGWETVLLVEDEGALRAIVAETLREAGYVVLEAADTKAATVVAAQSQQPIHLLITDMVLPGQSGPQFAMQVESIRPGIRVLLMSGYTDRQISGHPSIEPGTPFLAKPFTSDALLRKVRDVLDRIDPSPERPA